MNIKRSIRFATVVATLLLVVASTYTVASADTYNVNASVPYAVPTQAATFTAPASGATFTDAQQTISGTCEMTAPPAVVSVWRNGQVIGSTSCAAGLFNLSVVLVIGQNELIARTANVNGIYGPDSASLTVTLNQPENPQPLPPAVIQPVTPGQQITATNEGSAVGLSVTTEAPFSLLNTENTASVRVIVDGGKNPYTIVLNWGDGSVETHSVDQPGTYEYSHTYQSKKSHTVIIRVRDVLGAFSEYVYAVVSNKVTKTTAGTNAGGSNGIDFSNSGWRTWLYLAVIAVLLFFLITSYWLGWERAKHRYEKEAKRLLVGKKKRRKEDKK